MFPKHGIRFDLVPIESNERLLQHMPLDRRHCLRDTTPATPAVFGNCRYPFVRPRRRYGVEDVPTSIRDVCIHVVGGTEDKVHLPGRGSSSERMDR